MRDDYGTKNTALISLGSCIEGLKYTILGNIPRAREKSFGGNVRGALIIFRNLVDGTKRYYGIDFRSSEPILQQLEKHVEQGDLEKAFVACELFARALYIDVERKPLPV